MTEETRTVPVVFRVTEAHEASCGHFLHIPGRAVRMPDGKEICMRCSLSLAPDSAGRKALLGKG